MTGFQGFPEQAEARRLLDAALAEGPAHAYLFHGPPGVGKRRAALGFAGALLGDPGRVERRAHSERTGRTSHVLRADVQRQSRVDGVVGRERGALDGHGAEV